MSNQYETKDYETKIMALISRMIPKMSELDRAYFLGYGEGMEAKMSQASASPTQPGA